MHLLNHLIVLAHHTNDPGDHYRRAFELFRGVGDAVPGSHGPGMSQWSGMSGGDGMWLLPLLVVVFLLLPKGGRERATERAAAGGISPLLIVGVVAVGAMFFLNGGAF